MVEVGHAESAQILREMKGGICLESGFHSRMDFDSGLTKTVSKQGESLRSRAEYEDFVFPLAAGIGEMVQSTPLVPSGVQRFVYENTLQRPDAGEYKTPTTGYSQ